MARIGAVVFLVILLSGLAMGQDPGIPDTVSFGPWEAIVPADSPWTGNIRVPVRVFNDERLQLITLLFKWSGPWVPTGGIFVGNRSKYFGFSDIGVGHSSSTITLGAVAFGPDTLKLIPPDSGVFAFLCFNVIDTGAVSVDTASDELEGETYFITKTIGSIVPVFAPLERTINSTDFAAGDVNLDGLVNLSDIIALWRFTFNRSFIPPILNLCDVNADCKVGIVDVVYLVGVVIRGNFSPRFGCVC